MTQWDKKEFAKARKKAQEYRVRRDNCNVPAVHSFAAVTSDFSYWSTSGFFDQKDDAERFRQFTQQCGKFPKF